MDTIKEELEDNDNNGSEYKDPDDSASDCNSVHEYQSVIEDTYNDDEIKECRKQLEAELRFSGESKANDSIRRYIESCSQYLSDMSFLEPESLDSNLEDLHDNVISAASNDTCPVSDSNSDDKVISAANNDTCPVNDSNLDDSDEKVISVASNDICPVNNEEKTSPEICELNNDVTVAKEDDFFDAMSTVSGVVNSEDEDVLGKMDPNSRMYRLKMIEKLLSDTRSQRSYSTTASTIAPSVITERIRRNMDKKEKQIERKRCVAKGEASAVHRHRKENKDVIKEYRGWEF